MKQQNEGLYSLKLELENFKNIEKKVIDIGGRSMLFIGKNNTGKSTLIQAMMSPADSKLLPTEPIKEGEERAKILHRVGGTVRGQEVEYVMELFFTPKNNKGRLVLTDAKTGENIPSPASKIKQLFGNVSFDITKWMNETKAKKLEMLKSLTGQSKEIDVINIDIKKLKDGLKYKSARAEELTATVKNNEFTPEELDRYAHPVDIVPLQQKMTNIATKQKEWDGVNVQVQGFKQNVTRSEENIRRSSAEIQRLHDLIAAENDKITYEKQEIIKNESNIQKGEEWLARVQRPLIEAVNAEINEAIAHNEKHARFNMIAEQHKEKLKLVEEVEKLKMSIKSKEKDRSDVISKSQLPVEGLSFDDEEIYLHGLPLESEQINKATLFDVGVEIAIALNPNYKGIFLHDFSLFDREHMRSIVKRIEERGYFVIAEMVAENDNVECVFAESYLQ